MTDIAVIYNFAEHPGGGDLVALDIIEALIENKYNVHLYTSHPQGFNKAITHFLKDRRLIDRVEVHHVSVPKCVKHPYNIYLITKRTLSELKQYDLVVLFDDIPKPAQKLKRLLVYVHYPHAARIKCDVLRRKFFKESLLGRILWKIHSFLFKRTFVIDNIKDNILILANSSLTLDHVRKYLNWNAHLLYPPVQSKIISETCKHKHKRRIIVSLGRIEPEREYEVLIRGVAILKRKHNIVPEKVVIVGFKKDNKYLKYLLNLIREYGLENLVSIEINASREDIYHLLCESLIIVSTHPHEQFGIAVVEGMAAGCIPVVRKGLNGPWVDIIKEGQFGNGYASPEELANILLRVLHLDANEISNLINKLVHRALEFDEEKFKTKFVKFVREFGL